MDQIDRRIGLEEIAPHPPAGMRLPRHQQHPEPFAHAGNLDHVPVVDLGQFARPAVDLDLEDVEPGVIDFDVDLLCGADRGVEPANRLAVAGDGDPDAAAGGGRVLDADLDLRLGADQAEARRLVDEEDPVVLAGLAVEQRMQGAGETRRGVVRGNVVNLAVGQQDCPGDAALRRARQAAAQRLEQPRAGAGADALIRAGPNNSDIQIIKFLQCIG